MFIIEVYLDSFDKWKLDKSSGLRPRQMKKKHHVISGKKRIKISDKTRKKLLNQLKRLRKNGRKISYA